MRPSAFIFALAVAATVQFAWAPVFAAGPDIPAFWDRRERVAKPDLSKLRRLRFITSADFPPFNFIDSGGRLAGYNIDLARAICSELGIADICQIEAAPWSELGAKLKTGDGEAIIAGLEPTAENRAEFAFSRSYLGLPARFVTQRGAALDEPLNRNLKGKRVGVISGTAHEAMLRHSFPNAVIESVRGKEQLFADLTNGKIDAVFGDGMTLSAWLGDKASQGCCVFSGGPYLGSPFLGQGMGIAVASGNAQLANAFDHALETLEQKGTMAELYLRYFPIGFY
ncbi:transporter substrate-binding domain-containing protein [Phyllobacterium leguminum]|uniref:Amino acid ABC transporter substrate-binding protein (PAAT family) n=1 Tax=Phyllobacterium leguminum TaxID=314237 RepID=A0A318SXL7_9HYPH|nr:transporter substrate-binding domain-containing protein [Phyllobacterium leguminum]PYE85116.1 amino acid ABC transporter substrate-binding protein (PAAT family) [Phyllobacterium leguminum]